MLTNMITTKAALRARTESPFVPAHVAAKQNRPPRGVPR
jgi:hypothetical protein